MSEFPLASYLHLQVSPSTNDRPPSNVIKDELQRVIYLSSFSKTISPTLRAGFLVATPALAQKLALAKVMSSLGSSELLERTLLQILTHGHYRRHLRRLRERLATAHQRVRQELEARGVEFAFRPQSGLFLWGKLPSRDSVSKLWRLALQEDVLLAPGGVVSTRRQRDQLLAIQCRALRGAANTSFSGNVVIEPMPIARGFVRKC